MSRFLNKNLLLLAYKFLHDVFLLLLIAAFVLLVGEGLVPGLLSEQLSPLRVYLGIFTVGSMIFLLGNYLQIAPAKPTKKRSSSLPFFVVFLFLLIGNSMLKFALWQNLIITVATLAIFFLFYKILLSQEK